MASTEPVALDALPERIRDAVEHTASLYFVEQPLASAVAACCTTGEPVPKRFGRMGPPSRDYLILTLAYLIAVRDADRPGCVIWSLNNAEVHFVTESAGEHAVSGLAITAFRPGAAVRESGFLLLADDAAGRAFAEQVIGSVGSVG